MKVEIRAMKTHEYGDYDVEWPDGWPVPREGENITVSTGEEVTIRHVIWIPNGEEGDGEPYVYVVAR